MSGAGMENGKQWVPEAGVLPVIQSSKIGSVSQWVHKRMLSAPNEWDAETAAKDLVRRFELGRLAVESGGAERVEVWSKNAYLPLGDVLLMGDSAWAVHRWVLTREMFAENHAMATIWMEETLDAAARRDWFAFWKDPGLLGKSALPGGKGGVAVADFGRWVGLEEFPGLDQVAKACGVALLVGADLRDARGEPADATSYPTLAMQVALERGLDLTQYARTVAVVDEVTNDEKEWRGRILSAESDGAPIPLRWERREEKSRRAS